jgi:hypothetical protein
MKAEQLQAYRRLWDGTVKCPVLCSRILLGRGHTLQLQERNADAGKSNVEVLIHFSRGKHRFDYRWDGESAGSYCGIDWPVCVVYVVRPGSCKSKLGISGGSPDAADTLHRMVL